jgi:hypothetical protein
MVGGSRPGSTVSRTGTPACSASTGRAAVRSPSVNARGWMPWANRLHSLGGRCRGDKASHGRVSEHVEAYPSDPLAVEDGHQKRMLRLYDEPE